jgi:hypothetical protein
VAERQLPKLNVAGSIPVSRSKISPILSYTFQLFCLRMPLAVFAVEELAHRLPAGRVRFGRVLAFVGVHALLRDRIG